MKFIARAAIVLTCVFNHVHAAETAQSAKASEAEAEVDEVGTASESEAANVVANPDFCFFDGAPPSDVKYVVVKKLKLAKGTYGHVNDVLPKFADRATGYGADAITNYTGSQRFGFWPWRMVRPVLRGTAIKWTGSKKPDCTSIGGTTLTKILSTNMGPGQEPKQP